MVEILGLLGIHFHGEGVDPFVLQSLLGRFGHMFGIGHHAVRFTKTKLHGFDRQVRALNPVGVKRQRIQFPQDPQREEHGDALAIGRDLVEGQIAAGHRNRIHPHPGVVRQVFNSQSTPFTHTVLVQTFGQFAAVERITAIPRQSLQRQRVFRQLNLLAGSWRATIPGERARPTGEMTKLGRRLRPVIRGLGCDPKTILGHADGRLKQPGHRQLPKPFVQGEPRVDRSGRGDRLPSNRIDLTSGQDPFSIKRRRRTARSVESMQAVRVPMQTEGVRSQTIAGGLGHGQCRRGRDRGIDAGAPFGQHLEASLGCQRLTGGHHRFPEDGLAAGWMRMFKRRRQHGTAILRRVG